MITQDLGIATAYGYAKSKGYTGTEAEFAELMASYASTAQTAIEAADRAVEANTAAQSAKTDASASKTAAQTAAQTATTKASEANQSASTATTKASEASQSASTASTAATSASTSAQTATTAATTATTKASEASESATTASTAKTDAETARDAAAQSASRAEQSAESIDPDEFNRKICAAFATDTASGSIASFADGADDIPMKDVVVHIEPVQEGSGDPSPDNVRPITGWTGCEVKHSGADTSNPTTYPITFPSEAGTVYGAYVDVINGELVVDRAMVDFDGSSDEDWSYYAAGQGNLLRLQSYSSMKPTENIIPAISNAFKPVLQVNRTSGTISSGIGGTNIDFIFNGVNSLAEWREWLAENNVQLCYKLAEPIHYPITAIDIKTLLGQNNIWADTGDTEVEYRADVKLYINKKIAEAISALS